MTTGIVRDNRYLEHATDAGIPEHPRRLAAIHAMLDEPDMKDGFGTIPATPADTNDIFMVHTEEHVNRVAATRGKDYVLLTQDTHASAGSYDAALLAVGGLFGAIEAVVRGECANAFALVRPPGHHAETSRAMGYCLFNNIALAAMHAKRELGLERILIVDWDVHHGNGTQHIFEQDRSVLFFSIHQYPLFPGTGIFTETGRGEGEGFTVNIPIPRGYGDGDYVAIFERLLRPVALEFEPQLILVSAGFDTHKADPLGGMRMTESGFAGLTRSLMSIAGDCCDGRLALSLEGGYNVDALANSVRAVLNELSGKTSADVSRLSESADKKKMAYVLKRSLPVHGRFWKIDT